MRVCLVIVNAKVALSFPREEKTFLGGRISFYDHKNITRPSTTCAPFSLSLSNA